MKLGVCSNFRQADTVKKLGYDYIEEHFYRLSIYTEEEYLDAKKAYKDAGIEIYSTNCFFGPGVNIYGDDIYDFLDGYVDRTAKRAAELGVKLCVFGSGGARKVPEGMTYEEAEAKLIKVICYCADICGKYGMKLAIEPLQRVETNMIITVKEACEFARKANNENVGAIVDFHHFFMNGESDDGLKGCKDKLFHAHIARPNPDRKIPIAEDIEMVKKWKGMLDDIGYDKTLSLECIFGENWATEYEQAKPILELFK